VAQPVEDVAEPGDDLPVGVAVHGDDDGDGDAVQHAMALRGLVAVDARRLDVGHGRVDLGAHVGALRRA